MSLGHQFISASFFSRSNTKSPSPSGRFESRVGVKLFGKHGNPDTKSPSWRRQDRELLNSADDPATKLKSYLSTFNKEANVNKQQLNEVPDLRLLLNSRKDRGEWECLDDSCRFSNPAVSAKCRKCSLPRLSAQKKRSDSAGGSGKRGRSQSLSRERSSSGGSSSGRPLAMSRRSLSPEKSISGDSSRDRPSTRLSHEYPEGGRSNHSSGSNETSVGVPSSPTLSSSASSDREEQIVRLRDSSCPEEKEVHGDDEKAEAKIGMQRSRIGSVSPPLRHISEPVSYDDFEDTLQHHLSQTTQLLRLRGTSSREKMTESAARRSSFSQSDSDDDTLLVGLARLACFSL